MIYARIVLVIAVLSALGLIYYKGYVSGQDDIQTKWNEDKAEKLRIAKNQELSARQKEVEQNETTRKLQSKYSKARADLDDALRSIRLCDIGTMPREDGVPVAGNDKDSMSRDSKGSTGTNSTSPSGASITLGDALKDTLQCSTLIEWVKTQGLAQ